jgi:hypothetical protein
MYLPTLRGCFYPVLKTYLIRPDFLSQIPNMAVTERPGIYLFSTPRNVFFLLSSGGARQSAGSRGPGWGNSRTSNLICDACIGTVGRLATPDLTRPASITYIRAGKRSRYMFRGIYCSAYVSPRSRTTVSVIQKLSFRSGQVDQFLLRSGSEH